jgi:hypothetical protein
MRARMSWPRSSVPSGCVAEGVFSLARKSISSMGTRYTNGPATTATTIVARITVPIMASR